VNVQTFYVALPIANLLFATADPTEVYFPEHSLVVGADGSMRSTIAMTPGTVYTVISDDSEIAPSLLAKIRTPRPSPHSGASDPDLELPPGRYSRGGCISGRDRAPPLVRRLPTRKVNALQTWMSTHLRYSTDIPPLLAGQDAVNQFLFGSRVGYCEQISTALAVMLRTLGCRPERPSATCLGPSTP